MIGGSGLYAMEGLNVREERRITTPFGDSSDAYLIGELEGRLVAFLPRHGRGHRLLPTKLNYRANIFGMKLLGVEQIVSVSAVGSMKIESRADRPGERDMGDQAVAEEGVLAVPGTVEELVGDDDIGHKGTER